MVFQLLYVSAAVALMSEAELAALLAQSRRFNAEHGLTGMLLYLEGTFVQVLEGDEPVVRALYTKIMRDARHTGCQVYLERLVPEREFAEWSMGFRALSGIKPEQLPGFTDLPAWGQRTAAAPQTRGSLRRMLLHLIQANREL